MPGPYHGVLMVKDRTGQVYEVINQARTAAYLSHPDLSVNGISICDILEFGGCETYPYLPRCGSEGGYVDTPGTAGNTLVVADAPEFDISGDLTLIAYTMRADWTPTGGGVIFGRGTNYRMMLTSSGRVSVEWVDSGGTSRSNSAVDPVDILDGNPAWLAVSLDVNNGAGGRTMSIYTSVDGVNWVHHASSINAGTTDFQAVSTALQLSSSVSTDVYDGQVAYIEVRNGLITDGLAQGTVIFKFDGEADLAGVDPAATSFVSSSGHTVTVNHSGSPANVIVPYLDGSDWVLQTFDTPATDPAPWYNAAYPESADALGVYIEEWTGLGDSHVTRPTTTWGGHGGGQALGPSTATGRDMALNLILFGRTEAAVEYLFRWLSATFTGVCDSCAQDSILLRRFCGSASDPEYGVAELRRVGQTRGMQWEADLGNRGNCQIRRASVILTAGDPCMYLPSTNVPIASTDANADLVSCFDGISIDADRELCRPSCSELITECRTARTFSVSPMAAMAPVVTFDNNQNQYAFPFRAVVYADPLEIGWTPNPCGLAKLGEVYVRAMPLYSTLIWDVAGREIRFRDATTGVEVTSSNLIEPNDPPLRRYFSLPCSQIHIVLEPATMCIEPLSGNAFEAGGISFDPPQFPTVALSLTERVGCP